MRALRKDINVRKGLVMTISEEAVNHMSCSYQEVGVAPYTNYWGPRNNITMLNIIISAIKQLLDYYHYHYCYFILTLVDLTRLCGISA
jgi:hypothetical protein